VRFESWVPYEQLALRIGQADILLGIFGGTPKALRVIPNKFYQAIACARPIITMASSTYDSHLLEDPDSGVGWVPPANPEALAARVREWMLHPDTLAHRGECARKSYEKYYSQAVVKSALSQVIESISTR